MLKLWIQAGNIYARWSLYLLAFMNKHILPWVLNLSEKPKLYKVRLLKVLLLCFRNHLLKINFVQINLYYRITSSFLGNINQKLIHIYTYICPHMHMYVHTQIYTHTIGIYCNIWELGSVFENEEHVNVLPQLQTGKRLGSTGGSHIQHQWILYILWWGMSASALTELCY